MSKELVSLIEKIKSDDVRYKRISCKVKDMVKELLDGGDIKDILLKEEVYHFYAEEQEGGEGEEPVFVVFKTTGEHPQDAEDKARRVAQDEGYTLAGGYWTGEGEGKTPLNYDKYKVIEVLEGTEPLEKERDIVDDIMDYESGMMSDDEIVAFFQKMVDDGTVWNLQGHYGRTAKALIDQGLVTQN